jgi:hypothetical protein
LSMIGKVIHSIVALPFVYDAVQRLAGLEYTRKRLEPLFTQIAGQVCSM